MNNLTSSLMTSKVGIYFELPKRQLLYLIQKPVKYNLLDDPLVRFQILPLADNPPRQRIKISTLVVPMDLTRFVSFPAKTRLIVDIISFKCILPQVVWKQSITKSEKVQPTYFTSY